MATQTFTRPALVEIADRALAYHNEQVLGRYARKMNLSQAQAYEHWIELMRFLAICAATPRPCTPSNKLDQLWHEFILFTKDYAVFCQEILGVYVHHIPSNCPEVERYRETLTIMEQAYGPINEQLWPRDIHHAADCSGDTCTDYCDDDVASMPETLRDVHASPSERTVAL